MAGIDPRLLEKSRYGIIPVAADGLTPFPPTPPRRRPTAPTPDHADRRRGLRRLGDARREPPTSIMKLPGGSRWRSRPTLDPARLVAQTAPATTNPAAVPMEPVRYPDNDPGPQPLLTIRAPNRIATAFFGQLSLFRLCRADQFHGGALQHSTPRCSPESAKRPNAGSPISTHAPRRAASPAPVAQGTTMPSPRPTQLDAVRPRSRSTRRWASSKPWRRRRHRHRNRVEPLITASALRLDESPRKPWRPAGPLTTAMLKSKSGS